MGRSYRVISADSHLEVPVDRWSPRVPLKYRDRAPRRIKLPNGGDGTVVENRPLQYCLLGLTGLPYEKRSPASVAYEDHPGSGPPEQRLEEQDTDGVDAEILFGSTIGVGLWRGIRDDDAYKAMIRAYNEFLALDYCSVAPDRLVGMGLVPETKVDDGIAEMEYCAKLGLKGITLNAFPSGRDFPTSDDDHFWAAALSLNMPLTVHVSFGGPNSTSAPGFKIHDYRRPPGEAVSNFDYVRRLANNAYRGGVHAVQMVASGVFDRFPDLRIYFAELGIGWIPHFLAQMDDTYERNHHWAEAMLGVPPLARKPSEYVREHCFWGFLSDSFGVRVRDDIGPNRVMWGSDFPHGDSDWPGSRRVIDETFAGVPQDERYRMVAGNAAEFFHLDSEPVPRGLRGQEAGR